ncbi:Txe/YoeB family addiction module toxin [Mucilaginibacter arboris]|uniref:Txe/YoeB family addiction module toxin n=1 Tax=Mucilaginibacter arboris TaxID=2682090 RepID=UPI00293BC3D7|nr:Txe/YoeB family addiction module toxin [Mucilaginibacter arboris]
MGKPEQLKYNLAGRWSRRINNEHRIIYSISDKNQTIILNILSLKGHYDLY